MTVHSHHIHILYEDSDVTVVEKPDGLLVHNDSADAKETVASWFVSYIPTASDVGEAALGRDGAPLERSGVVHRLDRETSGVLILAKHQEAFLFLKHQFQTRRVYKEYRAFVYGTMKEREGRIDRPIGRSAKDFRLRSAQRGAGGVLRPALTLWETIGATESHTYLRLIPKTGRTHQLRVHLKAIHHPIVCDRLYAPSFPCELNFARLALHAHILGITLPSGETKRFVSPLPQSFIEAADQMGD